MSPRVQEKVLVLSLLSAITALMAFTIRGGMEWDGDFALYIQHAINIATGEPFAQSYYLPNPANPIAPAAYPPGLPVLLAPVYGMFGLSFEAMKYAGLAVFIGWLAVYLTLARRVVPRPVALGAMVLMGINPYFWELKNSVYSEFLFLLLAYSSLVLAESLPDKVAGGSRWRTTSWAAAMVFTVTAACLTRTVGVVLIPAIAGAAVLRERRLLSLSTVSMAVATIATLGLSALFSSDANTYLGYFQHLSLFSLRTAVMQYLQLGGEFFELDAFLPQAGTIAVFVLLAVLAFKGMLQQRRRIDSILLFTLFYAITLIFYPSIDARYGTPLWPLVILYAFAGLRDVASNPRLRSFASGSSAVMLALLLALAAAAYLSMDFGPFRETIADPRALELYRAVEKNVPPDGVVLARKPTIIGLYTHRRASIWKRHFDSDEVFWDHARSLNAGYVVQDARHFGDGAFTSTDSLDAFVARNPDDLVLLFENEWFRLYRLNVPPESRTVRELPTR